MPEDTHHGIWVQLKQLPHQNRLDFFACLPVGRLLFLSRKKVNRRPGFLFKLDAETVLKMAITIKNSTIDFLKKLYNNRAWLSSRLSFASAKESGKEKQSRF